MEPTSFLGWLLFLAIPLLFVFAYPRSLFSVSPPQRNRLRISAIIHGLGAATTAFLFPVLALPFWENPLRDVHSLAIALIPLIVLPVFLVAALSLLLKNRSSLATIASLMFWPYWLLLALVSINRFFQETAFRTVFCFLCLIASVLFAFAAGAVSYRPALAHTLALAGLVVAPWVYCSTLMGSQLGNAWLMFNLSDKELVMYPRLSIELTILSIALIALGLSTAACRALPSRWQFRKSPVRERTWPAFAATLLFLGIWFSQSVMPYRIPGAVDYSYWPILGILHVEKRGLQFHETSVSVSSRRDGFSSFSISRNDRRLFQYRFKERAASGKPPEPIMVRVRAIVQSADYVKTKSDAAKPLRAWNGEGWYFYVQGSGVNAYTTDKESTPPQAIIDLFRDLEDAPRSAETTQERKDVCLGFCYDPVAGLGFLYSNHRCFNDGHGDVCR
jgi:hypothetical protein